MLAYGDHGGAVGYLVGEENRGLEYMFIMMNLARFSVGMEGVGLSERAYQRAVAYARERVQGRPVGVEKRAPTAAPIIEHPDIRRMLMTMRAYTEAMRALGVRDRRGDRQCAARIRSAERASEHQAFVDFMIPIVKGWCTEMAQEVTSLGVQVHGGMGFIEETGAAQHYRDARIMTIYEGTTGIQANDLIGRKTARDGGAVARVRGEADRAVAADCASTADPIAAGDRPAPGRGLPACGGRHRLDGRRATARTRASPMRARCPTSSCGASTAGGWQLGRAALIAAGRLRDGSGDAALPGARRLATARFYAEALLPQAAACARAIADGSASALALATEQF